MFKIINYKEIYKQLSKDVENICQIILKHNFRERLLSNQNYNVMLIFYHLVVIIYIIIKNDKGINKAEHISKKLIYETIIRLPREYEETLVINASNIITKYMAVYRQSINNTNDIKFSFSEELSKGICEILTDDVLFFTKPNYQSLISELKKYIDEKIQLYNNMIK